MPYLHRWSSLRSYEPWSAVKRHDKVHERRVGNSPDIVRTRRCRKYFFLWVHMKAEVLVVAREYSRLAQHVREISLQDGRFRRRFFWYYLFIIRECRVDNPRDISERPARDYELRVVAAEHYVLLVQSLHYLLQFERMAERDEEFNILFLTRF